MHPFGYDNYHQVGEGEIVIPGCTIPVKHPVLIAGNLTFLTTWANCFHFHWYWPPFVPLASAGKQLVPEKEKLFVTVVLNKAGEEDPALDNFSSLYTPAEGILNKDLVLWLIWQVDGKEKAQSFSLALSPFII